MKRIIRFLIFFTLFGSRAFAGTILYGFSPNGSAQNLILHSIDDAKKSIDIAAYSFTSKPISLALLAAKKRGVQIRIVADYKANAKYTAVSFIKNAGVIVRLNSNYEIMHNKFMVIDGVDVQTGSFNYTSSASVRNAENVIVIKNNEKLAGAYEQEFMRLFNESEN
nr:phospholipase D family protein [Pantoea ananatis]